MIGWTVRRFDVSIVARQVWKPLVGLSAEEAIKPLKTHPQRPAVKRASTARFIDGCLVPFADIKRAITALFENLGKGGLTPRHPAIVAGITGCIFRDDSQVIGVMVMPGQKTRA